MDLIMYVLVGALVLAGVSVAYVVLRNRVMFKIGVRNIPRRRAQTVLIVLGLMLSTLIISAAFTTGDTVDRSITGEVYSILGSLDETIQLNSLTTTNQLDNGGSDSGITTAATQETSFSQEDAAKVVQALRQAPLIDAVIPAYYDVAVAVNPVKRQSSPQFAVLGLDPAAAANLPDIETASGVRYHVSDLGPGQIFLDASAADALEVKAGDEVDLHVLGKSVPFTVKAVVRDRRLAGAGRVNVNREGGVLPLATVQDLFQAPGRVTFIAISNVGDARGGLAHSSAVTAYVKQTLASTPTSVGLGVTDVKRAGVNIAELGANLFTTFFLVLGLFSIAAGVLLIFMIFVMLAAERKPEMGMARAVGTNRADLVQTFLSEGMAYNLLAALVGTGLGVVVAFIMARIMAALFSQFDINISPHVTLRSLVISYSLGVVVTFFTVAFSSWRVSNINIVRAIRDIPEPPLVRPRWRAHGFWPTLRELLIRSTTKRGWATRGGLFALGLVLAFAGGGAPSALVRIPLLILTALSFLAFIGLTFKFGPLFVVAGVPMVIVGAASGQSFPLFMGLSLVPLGLALLIRSFGANERLTFTAAGLVILYIWEFDFGLKLVERIFGKTSGGIEMFFLSGIMVTVAATFVLVYNSDLLLAVITRLGGWLGALLPSIRMAVAYPLANRTRTGLTMAMFCLVVFALIVMSSMNYNFNRVFLSSRALGGWDVVVQENPANPISDLKQTLAASDPEAASRIDAVGTASIVGRLRGRLCQPATGQAACDTSKTDDFHGYLVRGDDQSFVQEGKVVLQARARGYDSDAAVWQAIDRDPSLAIIDVGAIPGGGAGFSTGIIHGVKSSATAIDPIPITLLDRVSGRAQTVKVIGLIDLGSTGSFSGLHVSTQTLEAVFGKPDTRAFYVRTTPGTDNNALAHSFEAALLDSGAQASSLKHNIDQQNATSSGFFYLMQGFMGLGLFVGVAAVGVVAFRTVVERRQQIGMLRALGYTRPMIALTFLIESTFIAVMGIGSGIIFALVLAWRLITEQFAAQGVTSFAIPWVEVAIIGGLAFGFALLMTVLPSQQAARIPIAQALRYE